MQVSNLLIQAKKILAEAGIDTDLLDAKILLSYLTGKSKESYSSTLKPK
jgi:hypothetical protein